MANKKQKIQERRRKREFKKRLMHISFASGVLAAISLIVGAFFTGYEYANATAAQSSGASAPTEVALFTALPYVIAAVVLLTLSAILYYNSKKKEKSCLTDNAKKDA